MKRLILSALAAIGLLVAAAPARAACLPSGILPLNLGIPGLSDSGTVWAQCVRNNFISLSSATTATSTIAVSGFWTFESSFTVKSGGRDIKIGTGTHRPEFWIDGVSGAISIFSTTTIRNILFASEFKSTGAVTASSFTATALHPHEAGVYSSSSIYAAQGRMILGTVSVADGDIMANIGRDGLTAITARNTLVGGSAARAGFIASSNAGNLEMDHRNIGGLFNEGGGVIRSHSTPTSGLKIFASNVNGTGLGGPIGIGYDSSGTYFENITSSQNGRVGIGNTNPETTLDVGGTARIADALGVGTAAPDTDIHVQKSASGDGAAIRIENTSDSANSKALLELKVAGGSAGDALVTWQVGDSTRIFAAGIDNSDGDKWKLSASGGLGTADAIKVDTAGNDVQINSLTVSSVSSSGTVDADEFTEGGSSTLTNSITGNAATATALAADGANCDAGNAPLGVGASGVVQGCFDVATQTELDSHTGSNSAHNATAANTADRIVLRDGSGNFAAGTVTAALSGNATTATALAANGANCAAGQYPLGVSASGAAEDCTVVSAPGTVPPGAMMMWTSSNSVPTGWLLCNGQSVSTTTHAVLFGVVGYRWGGSGANFNVPDMRQRFPLGQAASGTGATFASSGGAIDHTHTAPAHYHGMGTGADLNITASGSHAHSIESLNNRNTPSSGSETIANTTDNTTMNTNAATHTHASGDFSGRIGLVTGGVNGNAEMTSGTNNPPFLVVHFIIYSGV